MFIAIRGLNCVLRSNLKTREFNSREPVQFLNFTRHGSLRCWPPLDKIGGKTGYYIDEGGSTLDGRLDDPGFFFESLWVLAEQRQGAVPVNVVFAAEDSGW